VTIDLSGTSRLKDVRQLKLYRTKNKDRFDHRTPGQLVASAPVKRASRIKLDLSPRTTISSDDAFWVVCDVAPSAQEDVEL